MWRKTAKLTQLDAGIITHLQSDGRKSSAVMARELGVAEATVRRRIERLLRKGIMQIGAWADPLQVGYEVYVIQVQTVPAKIEKVAESLAKFDEIFFLGITTGEYDIYAAAVIAPNGLYEFMTRRLMRVPGVVRTATSNMVAIVKRQHGYPVPAGYRNGDTERSARDMVSAEEDPGDARVRCNL